MLNINATSATVSFMAKYNLELDYDTCFFEVSTDIFNQTPEVIAYFTGNNSIWTAYSYDISQYIGQGQLYFSWRIKTDQALTEDGIYIDDFLVKVMENGNAPARFLETNIYDQDVHLSWAPPMAGGEGWFSYINQFTHYNNQPVQRGQYFNLSELGNQYPMELGKIYHYFYDAAGNSWNGNNRYSYVIYNKNGLDIIWESEQLIAQHWGNEYVLPNPITLTEDVLIAVKPVSSTGQPFSLLQVSTGENSRGFKGNPDDGWANNSANWATEIYLTNPVTKQSTTVWGVPGVALKNLKEDISDVISYMPLPDEVLEEVPPLNAKNTLAKNVLGYNIYCDGSIVNPSPVTNLWYQDKVPHQGRFDYNVKAVFASGGDIVVRSFLLLSARSRQFP
jgi:hypothetical protein